MSRRVILTREDSNVREIDNSVINKWCWSWMEHEHDGLCLNSFMRKLNKPGLALCLWCDKEVNYAGKGLSSLVQHADTLHHKKSKKLRDTSSIERYFYKESDVAAKQARLEHTAQLGKKQ